jgi:hypothetical protein
LFEGYRPSTAQVPILQLVISFLGRSEQVWSSTALPETQTYVVLEQRNIPYICTVFITSESKLYNSSQCSLFSL